MDRMEDYIMMARKSLTGLGSIKHYVQEVLKKASINKASKIYEHGISLGHTADLLGLTQWELAEYTSQSNAAENEQSITVDVKKRAKMALEFFS
jgi:predicted transcriptional regulator